MTQKSAEITRLGRWFARLRGGETRSQQVSSEEVRQAEGTGMIQDEDEDSREEYYYRITGLNQRQTLLNVDEFIAKYNLDNIRGVLRKGATLAHSPERFWLVEGLNNDDIVALGSEAREERRWLYGKQDICDNSTIKAYYMGAILFGESQTLNALDIVSDGLIKQPKRLATMINLTPFFVSTLVGCWLMAYLNRRFGRCGTMRAAGACIFIGSIASIAKDNWKCLFFSRLLRGIGMGVLSCVSSIYGAEISTARSRGRAVSWWQFASIIGRVSIMICTALVDPSGATGITIEIITAVLLLIWVRKPAESPHWLVLNGQMYQAYLSLYRLRKSEVRAARDLYKIYIQTVPEQQCYRHTKTRSRICQLVMLPRLRRALQAAAIVSVSALLSNAQIVDTERLASSILSDIMNSRFNIRPLFLILIVYGIEFAVYFARAFSAYAIEVYGRRGLLLGTMPHVLWPLLLAALSGALQDHKTQTISKAVLQALLMLIMAVCDFVPLTYCAEIFPLSHRDVGVPLIILMVQLTPIIELIAPRWLNSLSHDLSFLVAFAAVMISMIYLFMRETRRYPLEEIPRIFEVSSKNIMSYRLCVEVPYLFKRYILRKDVELEHFEESRYNRGMISLDNIDTTTSV